MQRRCKVCLETVTHRTGRHRKIQYVTEHMGGSMRHHRWASPGAVTLYPGHWMSYESCKHMLIHDLKYTYQAEV
jgi:hypothetical protein